jgi:hypothetical protein
MMASYFTGMGIAAAVVVLWCCVQQLSRTFHRNHPEALPSLESMGCHHCSSASRCDHGESGEACESFGKVEDRA